MSVKRSRNMKNICFIKTVLKKIEWSTFANKHIAIIGDTSSKLLIETQKQCHTFSLSRTFNNPRDVLIANF